MQLNTQTNQRSSTTRRKAKAVDTPLKLSELSDLAYKALDAKKADDMISLTLPFGAPAKTLIICTATSERHAITLADNVADSLANKGEKPLSMQGQNSPWVLLDYGPLVVHIFTEEARDLYKLEKLWSPALLDDDDAKTVAA